MARADTYELSIAKLVVIKRCLVCGHTQYMQYRYTLCPTCNHTGMFFHETLDHLIRYIDRYGLGNINIVDEKLRNQVLEAFSRVSECITN